ncbi:MAG: uracil-DNA glycosylase [Myxococcota bacterium]
MSGETAQERAEIVGKIRDSLRELASEGVDFVAGSTRARRRTSGRAPRPTAEPEAPAPRGFQPHVAPLAPQGELDAEATEKAAKLARVREDLGECTRCPLSERRQSIVFGEGHPAAPVVFIGEGPGAEEDRSGRPFVGRAGELLTRIIESVGWRREDVFICNIVKCRPPGNRDPRPEEVGTCRPFLERQILAIRPAALVTLGKPAASTMLGRAVAITKTRGIWHEWNGIPLMPTYHPAYLLRNYTRETRQAVWDDLKAVRARVDEGRPG